MLKSLWKCMFGPRLLKIYKDGPRESQYQAEGLEKWGDRIISMANSLRSIVIYTIPFTGMYIYKRGFFSMSECYGLAKLLGCFTCILVFSFIIRGIGRAGSAKYTQFLSVFNAPRHDAVTYFKNLRKYDFEFAAWPAAMTVAPRDSSTFMSRLLKPFRNSPNADLPAYQRYPLQLLAFIAMHTFALRLIYPGSLGLIHNLLWAAIIQGRALLVEEYGGKRNKLITGDGNTIDTMFVDNRGLTDRGGVLVICCEGNSGFYEVGIMTTPIKAGYSSLGWNHPGFAESTGLPYPDQEHNAIDAVIQYAITELNFKPNKIIMFGWSIGGYSAAWACTQYPDIKALVLDATFDDLLPLALNQMPSSWSVLVKEVVRAHANLAVADLVCKYDGPVHLVRRTDDEIICLRPGVIASNRANDLLVRIVHERHPDLPKEQMDAVERFTSLLDQQRSSLERSEVGQNMKIPLRLISSYMRDYRSSHCTPLPDDVFEDIVENLHTSKK